MYGFDIGMHVSDNLVAIEKKERAEAQAKAKARAQAEVEAKALAQAHADALAKAQAQTPNKSQPQSQEKSQKQKPSHLTLPFNVFQASQMQKQPPGGVRPASAQSAQRPGGPNRAITFPAGFPSGFSKPVTPVGTGSGLSSLAASAYNSPLPSPGLNGPPKNAWFPFSPKPESGDSNISVCQSRPFLSMEQQLTTLKVPSKDSQSKVDGAFLFANGRFGLVGSPHSPTVTTVPLVA